MVSAMNPVASVRSPQPEATSRDPFIFPLHSHPSVSHRTGGRSFGAGRRGRSHAACDLIAPAGTDVLAMRDGQVIQSYPFWEGTDAVEIEHDNGMVIRYCEISVASGIRRGTRVSRGQVIGAVKRSNRNTSMLHLEMYQGTSNGPLTQRSNSSNYRYVPPRNYQRRSDLLDPNSYLDEAILVSQIGPNRLQEGYGQVNDRVTSTLNVRSQPNTSSSVVLRIRSGDRCRILNERVTGSAYYPGNRTDWYQIEFQGQQGYVAAYYIDYKPVQRRDNQLTNYPRPFQKWVEVVARSSLKQQFKIGIMAQSLHETGRGTSDLALNHNNFNGMQFRDVHREIDGARPYPYRSTSDGILTDYVAADTPQIYLECYLAFINRDHYQGWEQTNNPRNFIQYLYDRGYATDPDYMTKVDKFFQEAEDILFFDTSEEEHGWYRIAKSTQDDEYYLVCMAGGEAISKVPLERTVADLSEVLADMLQKHPNARTWASDTPMDLSGVPLYPVGTIGETNNRLG